METARIFMNGRSEAVRLPKNCRFASNEVYIKKVGDMVLLVPKNKAWDVFMEGLSGFSDDFMASRPNERPQNRAAL
jgi:antitoxin VapB